MKQKAVKFISRGLFNPLPSSVYSVGLMKQLYLDVTIISVTKLNMFVWTGVCWLALSGLNSVSGPEMEEVDSAVYLSGARSWGPTKQVCWLFHFSSGGFSVVWIRMINGEAPPSDSNFTLTHTHTLRVTWLTEWWSCALEGNHHSGGLTDWTAHVFSCYHFFSLVVRFCLQTAGRTGSSNICFISSLEIHFVLRKVTYHQSCHWFENENILNPQLIVTLVRSWIPSLLSVRCWRPHSDSQMWTSGISCCQINKCIRALRHFESFMTTFHTSAVNYPQFIVLSH